MNSINRVDAYAFEDCVSLSEVSGLNAEVVSDYAFLGCTSLRGVTMSNKVREVSTGAFRNCANPMNVTYYGSEQEWAGTTIKSYNDPLVNASVTFRVPVERIDVSVPDGYAGLFIGESIRLSAVVSPERAYSKDVVWTSGDPRVATVDQNGTVTAVQNGSTEIYARSAQGDVVGSKSIEVVESKWISGLKCDPIDPRPYTGSAICPPVVIRDGAYTLRQGVDYTVAYRNNVERGSAQAEIAGMGKYRGTRYVYFDIGAIRINPVVTLSNTRFVYNGNTQKPTVIVKDGSRTISADNYRVGYSDDPWRPGTYTVTVTLRNNYEGAGKATFTIVKAENTLKAKGKTVKLKRSAVKQKKRSVSVKKAFSVSGAEGKVTYKKLKGNKKISVSKNGKITVKKGLKKGKYKVKVRVKAGGNEYYNAKSKTVTVTVRIR